MPRIPMSAAIFLSAQIVLGGAASNSAYFRITFFIASFSYLFGHQIRTALWHYYFILGVLQIIIKTKYAHFDLHSKKIVQPFDNGCNNRQLDPLQCIC